MQVLFKSFYSIKLNKADYITDYIVVGVEQRFRLIRTNIFSSSLEDLLQKVIQDGLQNFINSGRGEKRAMGW